VHANRAGVADDHVRASQNPPQPQPLPCPYCRKALGARPDGTFHCERCGEFPNYGRLYATPR